MRRHGISGPIVEVPGEAKPFYPYHAVKDTIAMAVVFALLLTFALGFRVPLDSIADPSDRRTGRPHTRIRSSALRERCRCRGTSTVRALSRLDDAWGIFAQRDKAHPELVEQLFEYLALFCGQVASRLLFEQREDVDDLLRRGQIRLARLIRARLRQIAEVYGRGVRERDDEAGE